MELNNYSEHQLKMNIEEMEAIKNMLVTFVNKRAKSRISKNFD